MENNNDRFSKVERFLLRLALIVLLAIGLLKVIAPEIKSLGLYFNGGHESSAPKPQSEPSPKHASAADDLLP